MAITHDSTESAIADAELHLHREARRFLAGELAPEKFKSVRVAHGIYEQRLGGSFMIRVKLAGGLTRLDQLQGLARLALNNGVSRLHLTTRQDIQLHDQPLESALSVQAGLASLGLTSYGSGGSTVRNVAADPLSGLLPDEVFDVRPYALAVAARYHGPGSYPVLPRKFKIAFSASDADHAGATTADLGFIARRSNGEVGFQVFVAGGLGNASAIGLQLYPWLEAAAIGRVTQGLLSLFATHGDGTNRHTARLRHLRKRLGDESFLQLCRDTIATTIEAATAELPSSFDAPRAYPTPPSQLPPGLREQPGIVEEQEPGRFSVRLAPAHGDLTPAALLKLGEIAEKFAAPSVRIGFDQELWLTGIGGEAVGALFAQLNGHGYGAPLERGRLVVACSGAATCQLGLLRSRDVGDAIEREASQLKEFWKGDTIRISGCPNACGRHLMASLGFEGRFQRSGERRLPSYSVFFGGARGAESTRLASKLGVIPAKRLPEFVVAATRRELSASASIDKGLKAVKTLVEEFAVLPTPVPEDWFLDWGRDTCFDHAELGEGECGAAV